MAGSLGTIRGTIAIDYDGKGIIKAEKDIDGLKKTGEKTGQSMQRTGNQMGIAAAVIAGGFALAVGVAAKFEKSLSGIQAVSGATAQEMEKVRAKALQLGKDTAFSATESSSAMEELIKAGLTVSDVLDGAADATVALAAAGGVALPEAAAIAANSMNQFGLTAKEMPKIADLIAGAANSSAIDVSDFGFSIAQAGAVAHLAGLSFADTALAITALGNAGIKGSDAGTSIKTFLSNLIPVTKIQQAEFDRLGITTNGLGNQFFDASGKVKSMADISGVLAKATKGMTQEQKLASLEMLFGSDAIRAAAVFAEQGAEGMNNLAKSMGAISAADVAKTRLDNLSGSFEQLKGSGETFAIQLGTILLPILKDIVNTGTSLLNWFSGLSSGWQKAILATGGGVVALLAVSAAIIKVVAIAQGMMAIIAAMKLWAIWGKIAAAAQWIWNVSLYGFPLFWIILAVVAIIAIIVVLWLKCAWFRNAVMVVWDAIKTAAAAVAEWFMGTLVPSLASVWENILAAVRFLWAGWMGIWNLFAPIVSAVFSAIVSNIQLAWAIITAIFAVFNTLVIQPVIAGLKFLASGFMVWFNIIRDAVVGVMSFLMPYIVAGWNIISNGTSRVWNAVSSFITGIWHAIFSVVSNGVARVVAVIDGIKAVVDKIRNFFNQLKTAAEGGTGSLISFVAGIPGRVLGALGNLGGLLYDAGRRIIQGLVDGIQAMAGRVRDAVSNVMSAARNLMPFSPAKEGPFSGRGWTLYSGRSMMVALAKGILQNAQLPRNALASALGGASANIGVTGSATSSGASTGPVVVAVSRGTDEQLLEAMGKLIKAVQRVAPGVGQELMGSTRSALQSARSQ